MSRLFPVLLLLAACDPTTATVDTAGPGDLGEPGGPALSCAQAPASVVGLEALPVTRFHEGPLDFSSGLVEGETFVAHTSVQREWSIWAPNGADFGNLGDDPEFAGHGVLAAAYRSSTCGMEVLDMRAWRLPDDAGTTYVELTVEDSSGGCPDVCDMEQWVGAAVGVPIADFPFSGPVIGCVVVVDGCG